MHRPYSLEGKYYLPMRRILISSVMVLSGVALIIAALVLSGGFGKTVQSKSSDEITMITPTLRSRAQGNAMGDPDAPVKIVEYSDFQCVYCRLFSTQIEPAIVDAYVAAGKVYFVYRSLGDWLGPESQSAAEAAYCAGDQEKFWEYHDILFANQYKERFSLARLEAFAGALNLNVEEFRSCLNTGKYRAITLQDRADGESLGIQGTPSFLINGTLVSGNQTFEVFQKYIEAEISKGPD